MSPLRLRQADPSQADELTRLSLRSKAHWGYSREQMAAFQTELTVTPDQLADPLRRYVLAEQSGKVLGFYGLVRLTEARLELDALFVEPAHIGQGVGRALLDDARKAAASRGVISVVIQGDANAGSFYLAAGAREIGERESGSIPGRFLPEFEISLQPTRTSRPYIVEDRTACVEMLEANIPQSFAPNEREDYLRFLEAPEDYRVWERRGVVEGAHGLTVTRGRARVRWIMTAPEARGSGLGRAMMEHTLITARLAGIRHIDIAASQKSAPFFERFGARPLRTQPEGWGPGLDRIDMVLDLPG